jgi:peptidoglycan/LPS O-acetylase OafA/YrhL
MKYRPEIDGLRAIAVIPVILFHAGFSYFKGGFVGVDVFFVISGYLITTIILSEMEQGTFSLVRFYERRARRILPALFLVMLVCLPFAWWWLLPGEAKDFSQSLVAVSVYVSNILFWRRSGYWDAANEVKPLLHTWSLAVEEQYYVLFPLFLMLIWRFRKRWLLGALFVTAIISLFMAQWGVYSHPEAAFYLLPARAWELAIGAIISFASLYHQRVIRILLSNQIVNEVLALLGLLMIGYAIYAFDENIPFPGFSALLPTVGTGLIVLFSSPQTLVGRLLGNKVLVGIGLISYSAYLWHQPLFAFARHRSLTGPSVWLICTLVALTFLLAYLSWRYVEQPFRRKEVVSRKAIFSFAGFGSVFFILIGLIGHVTGGFDQRTTENGIKLQSIEQKIVTNYGLDRVCDLKTFDLPTACQTSDEPEIFVWGDSYAMHLVAGILASNPDAKIIQVTKSVCGPFFDVAPVSGKYTASWAEGCLEFTGKVREWLQAHKTVKYAVLSSPFRQYLSKDSALLFRDHELVSPNMDLVIQEFEKTLKELLDMGITPIVFSPPPANDVNLGRCLSKALLVGANLDECNFSVAQMSQSRLDVYTFLQHFEGDYRIVWLDKLLCDSLECVTHFDSTFIFRDAGHLSYEGSAELGKMNNFYQLIVADPAISQQQ